MIYLAEVIGTVGIAGDGTVGGFIDDPNIEPWFHVAIRRQPDADDRGAISYRFYAFTRDSASYHYDAATHCNEIHRPKYNTPLLCFRPGEQYVVQEAIEDYVREL